jgi:hypothetical protein
MTDPIAVSQRAREAAELMLIDVKASDCEPYMSRAVQAFARFEADAMERAAKVAASWGHLSDKEYVEAEHDERRSHDAGHAIAAAIRNLGEG